MLNWTKNKSLSLCLSIVFVAGIIGAVFSSPSAHAATGINEQINYQGRLLTAAGRIAPDGNYNLEFKIYQDGAGCVGGGTSPCGGTLKWTEDWVYGSGAPDNRVRVVNGYFSVRLGSITAFGSSVDWNQDTLWLSMNVGNQTTAATFAAASGDGEMLPFKRLSAAPYAMQAKNASTLNGLADTGFIRNQTTTQTNANFNIQSAAAASIGGIIQGASGQTADLLQFKNSAGTFLTGVAANGKVGIGAFDPSAYLNIQTDGTSVLGVQINNPGTGADGRATMRFTSAKTTTQSYDIGIDTQGGNTKTWSIRDTTSAGSPLRLVVDNGGNVGIGNTPTIGAHLQVLNAIDEVGLIVQGASGQTADLLQLKDSTGAALATVGSTGILTLNTLGTTNTSTMLCRNATNQVAGCSTTGTGAGWVQGGNSFGTTGILGTNDAFSLTFETNNVTQATIAVGGATTFKNSTNSTAAFAVQNAAASSVLVVDTTNNHVGVNTPAANATLDLLQSATGTVGVLITGAATSPTANYVTVQNSGGNPVFEIMGTGGRVHQGDTVIAPKAGDSLGIVLSVQSGTLVDTMSIGLTGATIFRNSTDSTLAFRVQNAAGTTNQILTDSTNNRVGIGVTALPATTLEVGGIATIDTLGTANTATYVCRNAASQLATCNTTGTGAAWVQGGNSFGATGVLGTQDANALNIITNNTTKISIGTTGTATFTPDAVTSAISITTGGIGTSSIAIGSAAGYIQKNLAAPSQNVLVSVAAPSTAGTTTQSGGNMLFGTTYWNGAASTNEFINIQPIRLSTTPGDSVLAINNSISVNQFAGSSSPTIKAVGASGQTADLFQLQTSTPVTVFNVSATGATVARNATNSSAGFAVQSASGVNLLSVNTTTSQTVLGQASSTTGQLLFNSSGSANNILLIGQAAPTANRTITLPNETGTVCLQSSAACGFALATGGTGYIQNQTTLQTNANFNIQSVSATSVTAVIQGTAGQTADLMDFKNNAGTVIGQITSAGSLLLNDSAGSNRINLNATSGAVTVFPTTEIGFDIARRGTGTGNGEAWILGISNSTAADLMDLGQTSSAYTTGGTFSSWLGNSAGYLYYPSTNGFKIGTTTTATAPVLNFGANGALTAQNVTNSTSGLAIQNAAGTKVFTVDTSNGQALLGTNNSILGKLVFGSSGSASPITLQGQAATTTARTISLPDESGTVCLQNSASCGFALTPASGSYIMQVPPTSAANTIQPTANSVVALTVNGTSGTATTALNVVQNGAATGAAITSSGGGIALGVSSSNIGDALQVGSSSTGRGEYLFLTNTTGTQTDGMLIDRNAAGGTTTDLLHLQNSAGTVGDALHITGTYTNLIDAPNFLVTNAGAVTASTATLQGASALTLGLTGTNTGSILFKGATGASGTLTFIGPANPSTNTITLPNETGTVCTTGSVCGATGSGNYLVQVPATIAANTITPTAASVIGLTVNGTSNATPAIALNVVQTGATVGMSVTNSASSVSGTGIQGMGIALNNATNTQSDGLIISRNVAGGTTTDLLHLQNSAGTVSDALHISGTFTNLIDSTVFTVKNNGQITLAPTGTSQNLTVFNGRVNTGVGSGEAWGYTVQNSAALDGMALGMTSTAYTTGGTLASWLDNSQGYLYYPSANGLKIGTSTTASTAVMNFSGLGEVTIQGNTVSDNAFVVNTPSNTNVLIVDTNAAPRVVLYASNSTNSASSTESNWIRSGKNTVTSFIGDNDSTAAYAANDFSGDLRFNGLGSAWGDFGFYPQGGGAGNFGNFRMSLAGTSVDTTPDAKLGVGTMYVANSIGIATATPGATIDTRPSASSTGMIIQAAASATANLVELKDSATTNMFVVGPSGAVTIANDQPVSVATSPGTTALNALTVTAATGGDTTIATTGVGGVGSAVSMTGGIGGRATAATTSSTGGAGGAPAYTSGTGGAATTVGTTRVGGVGGALSLTAGTGGAASGGTTNTGGAGGGVTIQGGTGGTGNGSGGLVSIQGGGGTGTGSHGTIGIGDVTSGDINIATSANGRNVNIATGGAGQVVTLGSTNTTSSVKIDAGTGNIDIGTSGSARTVNIATGAAAQTVTLGSTNGASALTLQGGTGTIAIGTSASARTVNIATGGAAQTVTLGSTNGASILNLDAGTGGVLTTLSATASTTAVCSSLANATAPIAGTGYQLRDCSAAPAADFAEMYPAAPDVELGDVVTQGSKQANTYNWNADDSSVDWTSVKGKVSQIVKSTHGYDNKMLGVVSDNYLDFVSTGYNIKKSDNPTSIAMVGRVLVKISTENGTIQAGDYLTSSATLPGYAMKATAAGYTIGQALDGFDGGTGLVMVLVRPGYYPGTLQGDVTTNLFRSDIAHNSLVVGDGLASDDVTVLVLDKKNTSGDPAEVDGAIYYNEVSDTFRCGQSGAWVSCIGGLLSANTESSAAIANTTAESDFSKSYDLPANYCVEGRVIRVTAHGIYSTNGAPSLNLKLKMGHTVLSSTRPTVLPSNVDDKGWTISYDMVCDSAPSNSSAVNGQGMAWFGASTGGQVDMPSAATANIATDEAQTIAISATWGTANPSNTVTLKTLLVEGLGP